MANTKRNGEREVFWRDQLARFRASGLSVRVFCRQEQLKESAFYAWRRTLAERAGQMPLRKQASAALRSAAPTAFVSALVTDLPMNETAIVLELAAGRVLRLPASTSVERLAQLVQALEAGGAR